MPDDAMRRQGGGGSSGGSSRVFKFFKPWVSRSGASSSGNAVSISSPQLVSATATHVLAGTVPLPHAAAAHAHAKDDPRGYPSLGRPSMMAVSAPVYPGHSLARAALQGRHVTIDLDDVPEDPWYGSPAPNVGMLGSSPALGSSPHPGADPMLARAVAGSHGGVPRSNTAPARADEAVDLDLTHRTRAAAAAGDPDDDLDDDAWLPPPHVTKRISLTPKILVEQPTLKKRTSTSSWRSWLGSWGRGVVSAPAAPESALIAAAATRSPPAGALPTPPTTESTSMGSQSPGGGLKYRAHRPPPLVLPPAATGPPVVHAPVPVVPSVPSGPPTRAATPASHYRLGTSPGRPVTPLSEAAPVGPPHSAHSANAPYPVPPLPTAPVVTPTDHDVLRLESLMAETLETERAVIDHVKNLGGPVVPPTPPPPMPAPPPPKPALKRVVPYAMSAPAPRAGPLHSALAATTAMTVVTTSTSHSGKHELHIEHLPVPGAPLPSPYAGEHDPLDLIACYVGGPDDVDDQIAQVEATTMKKPALPPRSAAISPRVPLPPMPPIPPPEPEQERKFETLSSTPSFVPHDSALFDLMDRIDALLSESQPASMAAGPSPISAAASRR
ncbi:hypothetical protein GGF32_004619 [Allomyces javanicus]|nr:hypothetical protein GGF32_004619 [Allomyces javanicus]